MRKWMASLALVMIALPGFAAGAKGGSVSAIVEFAAPAMGADGDRLDGDGGGAYADGRDRISAKIDSGAHNNDIVLDLSRTRGARGLLVDLTACADGSCDGRPFDVSVVWESVVLQTRAARLFDFPVGSTRPVRLWVHFRANGTGWWVRFDGEDRETDCRSHNATATRTAEKEWVITVGAEQVACLLTVVEHGKEARGQYFVPHRFAVRIK